MYKVAIIKKVFFSWEPHPREGWMLNCGQKICDHKFSPRKKSRDSYYLSKLVLTYDNDYIQRKSFSVSIPNPLSETHVPPEKICVHQKIIFTGSTHIYMHTHRHKGLEQAVKILVIFIPLFQVRSDTHK